MVEGPSIKNMRYESDRPEFLVVIVYLLGSSSLLRSYTSDLLMKKAFVCYKSIVILSTTL